MVDLIIPNKGVLHLPTNLSEITVDYLTTITGNVNVAPNYAIVAICIAATPFVRCDKNPKQSDGARAVFKLVKKNDPNNVLDVDPGDTIICAGTDIMRGYEVSCPKNVLNTTKVGAMILSCGKDEKGLHIKNPYTDLSNPISNTVVYTIDFKVVPLNDIHGCYKEINSSDIAKVTATYVD